LAQRDELRLSIQLIDSRHKPTELDRQLNEWLLFHQKPHIVVATKADKLSSNKLRKSLSEIEEVLPESKIIAYSSATGKGRDAVWREIEAAVLREN
jgi:GTP-binding protein